MDGHQDMMNGFSGKYIFCLRICDILFIYIHRDELKCQPHLSQAKGGRESQGVQGSLDDLEPCCEDEKDPDDVYGVYRGLLIHQSFHLVDIVNEFGKIGGFEAIIERLGNHKPNIPVKNLRFIISPLSKCSKMYSRKTAQAFIPKMHELTFETLESLSDVELRDLRKDFLERIVNSVENFLKRFKTTEEIAEIIETFQLKMAIRRLKCQTIERRVNGVQYIADICSRTRRHQGYAYTVKFITPDFLMKWIEDNKLLQLLFGNESHPQLMKQSVDILKFICTESTLKIDHLDIIWEAMERAAKKQDDVENELQTLCTVIDGLTFYLDQEHFDFLFTKFEKIDMKLFTTHHLQLMSALSKNTSKNSDPPQRCLDILWNVVQDESKCSQPIVDQAKGLIKDCLSSIFSQELRIPTMNKCIENLKEHKSVCSSLQLLVKIIELYPTTTHMSSEPVRWTIIGHLDDSAKLLDHFFSDVKYFKDNASKKININNNNDEEKKADDVQRFKNDDKINNLIMGNGKFKYLDEVKERLQFLQYVLQENHTIKLTEEHANILWESFVVNALTLKEREGTFGSFKKMVNAGRPRKYLYLQEGVPEKIFTNQMMKDISIESMTQSAYDCFERYFVFVNCQKNHLRMMESNKQFLVNNYDNLIGLEMLWQIALKSKNEIVNKKSTDLINKITNKISAELKDDIGRIRSVVLEKIMNELSESLSDNESRTERVLLLLHQFLNASESRGMGRLRPHEALSRGKKWHFTIIDKIHFNGYGKPNQFKVSIHEYDSLWDLRCVIGHKAETFPELVKIYFRGTGLNEDKNSLSLQQLNMRDGITIHCMKKDLKSERVSLLVGTPARLVQTAKNALQQVFQQFASNDDNTMSSDDMKKYILKCGAGENSASKTRIQTIFTQHGTQRSAYQDRLSLQGFYNFYRTACMDRPDHVWNDLNVFKYRYDLRKEDEARKEEEALLDAKPETLPRYILTNNDKYFEILFKDCLSSKSPKIKEMAWKLILRLPTNPGRKQQILNLKTQNKVDWEKLLPLNDLFSLVYGVLICESLTIEPESAISEQELEQRANWRASFLESQGFEHLIKVLFNFEYNNNNNNNNNNSNNKDKNDETPKDEETKYQKEQPSIGGNTEKVTQQLALTAVLKMVQSFLVGAISCNQSMSDVVDQIRSLSLNAPEEKKDNGKEEKTNNNVQNTKVQKEEKKKKKSYGGAGGSGELYDMDYAYLIESDDEDEEEEEQDATEDFTALLEGQFADAVMKASGMPESMYNETKNEWDQLEGISGGGGGEGDFIGPKLPHQMGGNGGGGQPGSNVMSEEKDGREEKGPPDAVEEDTKMKMGDIDEDIDVDMIADNAELPDDENDGDKDKDQDKEEAKEEKPPATLRQTSIKFHEIIKNVTEKYADSLLKSLDFPKLMKQLLNILKVASSDQHPTIQRDLVVRYAVRLWVSVLLYRPNLLLDLFNFLRKDPSFILAAIQSTDPELGSEFAKSIRKLCRYVDESPNYKSDKELQEKLPGIDIVKFFLNDILLSNLPKSDQKDIDPEQHFYLLISLMQEYSDKYNGSVAEFSDLFKYLTKELKSYKSQETFESITECDKVLVGLMTLLSVLLAGYKPYREECGKLGIIEELLNNFLFATGKTDQDKKANLPKCKNEQSRELAYRLVVQCILEVPQNYKIVESILDGLHEKVRTPNAWEYCPEKSVKSDRGFVGLKNLGSTCYMNSLLQQFYMMPHFRHALISSGVDLTKKMSNEEMKESLLFQLMRMFSFLSLSEQQAFDTINFCRAYKDETGRPVDVRIQQDAQEFFTILADRVETELKDSQYRYLLADTFGGHVVHQMICQGGCDKTRERKQPMPMISLPIKNRANMNESLDAFVQAETLDGVSCDHCQKKCQTLKRQVLHTLPNTIFFHLKRFELNFETFRHEKSNQRFEFPTEIDLEPFTREGLERREKEKKKDAEKKDDKEEAQQQQQQKSQQQPAGGDEKKDGDNSIYTVHPKEYYQYQLCGIVVHTGSAEAGHYYSYIKDRKTGEWNEFNDSLIKSFDLKYLDNDCFGGKKKVKSSAQWGGDWEHDQDKIKNAYILVYDRVNYTEPEHPEDIKKREEEEAKKKAAEAEKSPMPPKSQPESKQEQDNKEKEKDNDKGKSATNEDQEEKKEEKKLPEPINVNQLFDANVQEYVEKIPKVYDEVLDTNMKFMRDRQLFNLQYFQFIYNLICVAPTPECKQIEVPSQDNNNNNNNNNDKDTDKGKDEAKKDDKDKKINKNNPGLSVIKMATFVCFRFLARTADKRVIFNRFVIYLKFLYSSNIAACKWLLEYLSNQRQHVEQYILTTRDQLVMHGFSELVIHVLKQLKDLEADQLMLTEQVIRKIPMNKVQNMGQSGPMQQNNNNNNNNNGQPAFVEQQVDVSVCPSSKFMDLMLDLLEIAPKYWFRFNFYFKVIYEYSLMGYPQRNYLIDRQMINRLGDFYLGGNRSPYADGKKQYHIMGNRMYPPKFDTVVQIICQLLCACHTPATTKLLNFYNKKKDEFKNVKGKQDEVKDEWLKLPPTALAYKDAKNNEQDPDRNCLHSLSDDDQKLPHCRYLYDKMIGEAHHSRDILIALNRLVVHWSYEDETYSQEVIRMITEGVDKSGADQVQTYLAIMSEFITVDDRYRDYRLKQLHQPQQQADKGLFYFIKCYRTQHQPFSYESMKALVNMMTKNDYYAKYMINKRQEWIWWDQWLDQFCHRQTYIHNRDNQRIMQEKINFFENIYMPLLSKFDIECQRAQIQQGGGGGNNGRGGQNNMGYAGNMGYYGGQAGLDDNYFMDGNNGGGGDGDGGGNNGGGGGNDGDGGQPGGVGNYQYGDDGQAGGGMAGDGGADGRQNSRDDDDENDLYGNGDDDGNMDINEGDAGNVGDGQSDENENMQMQQDGDDDDDDDDVDVEQGIPPEDQQQLDAV